MAEYNWPYPDEFGQTETVDSDILVLGGGLAGCFAAIAAARKGKKQHSDSEREEIFITHIRNRI